MMPQLFAHPFSSYCQKVLIALYENDTPFEFRMLGPDAPDAYRELTAHWPIGKFPILLRKFCRLTEWTFAAFVRDVTPRSFPKRIQIVRINLVPFGL